MVGWGKKLKENTMRENWVRVGGEENGRGSLSVANGRGLSLDLEWGSLLFTDCLVAGPRGRRRIQTCFSVQLPILVQSYISPFLTQTTVL